MPASKRTQKLRFLRRGGGDGMDIHIDPKNIHAVPGSSATPMRVPADAQSPSQGGLDLEGLEIYLKDAMSIAVSTNDGVMLRARNVAAALAVIRRARALEAALRWIADEDNGAYGGHARAALADSEEGK